MSRVLPLGCLCATVLCGCWWNAGVPETDSWTERSDDAGDDEPRPEPQDPSFFNPDFWTLEIWGYYDGERLTDFQYHASSSGAVPAFAIVRFTDPQWRDDEEECYWAGMVKVQGWTVLQEDQYAAWGVTFEQTDTTCRDFDPGVWRENTPTTMLENHYYTMAYLPVTGELQDALKRETEGPMAWAARDDEAAVTFQFGFEHELGTFDHFMAGAAYPLKTEGENVVVWSPTGRPYPLDLDGEMAKHVVVAGSLTPLDMDLFFAE